jgi:hypothetical protein
MAAKKYRIEISPEHHMALSLQAAKAGMRLKDYVAPYLNNIIEPETKDFGAIKSEGPKVRESPPPRKDPKVPKSEDSKVLRSPSPAKDPKVLGSEDPVILAKRYILAELEAEREPTAAEVAEAVGMDPKRLGTLLGRAGVKARSVHRGGKKARRYTLDMKESIERLAA